MKMMNKKIPHGYKQTEVGIIPTDWEVVRLGDLSENGLMNGIFNDPKKVGSGVKLINVVNLYNEPIINYSALKLLRVSEKEKEKFSALKGDVFFTRSSLKKEGIARCNLFNENVKDTVFECHIMRIRPQKEKVNSYFLFRYCQSHYARKILISHSKTTSMTTIDQYSLYSLLVSLPSLKEQQKIADILTTWDDAINKQQELITAKQHLKKGLMQKLLSGQVRFAGFSDDWQMVRLGKIATKSSKKNKKELIKVVFSNSAVNGIVPQNEYFDKDIAQQGKLSGYYLVKNGDFVYNPRISKYAPAGPISRNLNNHTGLVSPLYTVFRIKIDLEILFLEYFFKGKQWIKYVKNIANYGARHDRMNISSVAFFNMPILLPSKPEQQKIADVLILADDEITRLNLQLTELKQQKKALMQQLLTGKIRVKL